MRAGERPLGVAEQRGLDQVRGNGRAIQREIGFGRARALAVQGGRHQLLAAPRFALDQDRKRRAGVLADLLAQLGDGGTGADDAAALRPAPAPPLRPTLRAFSSARLSCSGSQGLATKSIAPERARMARVVLVVLARQAR